MTVLVLGLSHKTAPVEQREKAALSEKETRAVLRTLLGAGLTIEQGLRGFVQRFKGCEEIGKRPPCLPHESVEVEVRTLDQAGHRRL